LNCIRGSVGQGRQAPSAHHCYRLPEQGALFVAVALGTIETPLTIHLNDPEVGESRREAVRLGRIGLPADISNGILYLLSDDASWVTPRH
jgi:NAD(P)-dependent dehydrogenase (short-subunit alcohol dehydrogenase family)